MFMQESIQNKLQQELDEYQACGVRMSSDLSTTIKKYQEAKGEAQTAYKGLENYQVILSKFEENLQTAMKGKQQAEIERDKALNEVRVVR